MFNYKNEKKMKKLSILLIGVLFIFSCYAQNTEIKTAEQGNSMFALELYNQLQTDKENVFFSPFSISSSLAMTYAGSAGETEAEMKEVMSYKNNTESFHGEFKSILNNFKKKGEDNVKISVAQSVWTQKGYNFETPFLATVRANYLSPVKKADFVETKNREAALKQINDWVAKQTSNKINNLLPKEALTDATKLVLISAIHFSGSWEKPFKKTSTKKLDFKLSSKKVEKMSFMVGVSNANYFENDLVQVVEIPYKGDATMIIFLPKEEDGFSDLQEQFTYENYTTWTSNYTKSRTSLTIPKFKIENDFDLEKPLKKMGMKTAFGKKADFSKMTGDEELFINKIIHKAYIEIDEDGTEAAAATAVVMDRKSTSNERPKAFRADHPFIFMIKENTTNTILFVGHFVQP